MELNCFYNPKNQRKGARKMSQPVKALATKSNNLNSTPKIYKVRRLSHKLSSRKLRHTHFHTHTHTLSPTHTPVL